MVRHILELTRKYTREQRQSLTVSFSGGEPTLNKNLGRYIRLAKGIGVGNVQLQTNGSLFYKNPERLLPLITAGLGDVFIANHSHVSELNKRMGTRWNREDFLHFVDYAYENNLNSKVRIFLNIVVNKINLFDTHAFIEFLVERRFIELLHSRIISFGLIQPNGYAEMNGGEVLLKYTPRELEEIRRIIELCKAHNILPDFHFTAPPLCVLNYPEYNLEYERLKKLEYNK